MQLNKLIRAVIQEHNIRIYYINNINLLNQAIRTHNYNKIIYPQLGQLLTISSLLSSSIKQNDTISLKLTSNDYIKLILIDVYSNGNLRMYIETNNKVIPKLPIFKENTLIEVSKSINLKSTYTSSFILESSDIINEFINYFNNSEQIKTHIKLFSSINDKNVFHYSMGLLFQLLPSAIIEDEKYLYKLSNSINAKNLYDSNLEALIPNINILCSNDIEYQCRCSNSYYYNKIGLLPKVEILNLINQPTSTKIICKFCNKQYIYPKDKLIKLLN